MRSTPSQCVAGKRARRFLVATSGTVIRVAQRMTGASVRLASVVHTFPLVAAGAKGYKRERFPGVRSGGGLPTTLPADFTSRRSDSVDAHGRNELLIRARG